MSADRISDERLADQWFGFMQKLLEGMQKSLVSQQISQREIADKLGKDPAFISRCFSGRQNMTVRTAHDIARAMNCRLEVGFVPLSSLKRANNQPVRTDEPTASPLGKASGAGSVSNNYIQVQAA